MKHYTPLLSVLLTGSIGLTACDGGGDVAVAVRDAVDLTEEQLPEALQGLTLPELAEALEVEEDEVPAQLEGVTQMRRALLSSLSMTENDLPPELRSATAQELIEVLQPEASLLDPDGPAALPDLTAAPDATEQSFGCISSFQNWITGKITLRNCGNKIIRARAVVHWGPDIYCHWLSPGQSSHHWSVGQLAYASVCNG